MQHPLMQQRLGSLTHAMDELAVVATPMGTSLTRPRSGTPPGPQADCRVALNFLQAACLLLPLVALAWHQPLQQRRRRQQQQHLQQEQQREQQAAAAAAPPARRGAEAMRAAWQWVDRTLHTVCLAHMGGAGRAAWLCWLMPVLWLLARGLNYF
jgi:hypothetical protein